MNAFGILATRFYTYSYVVPIFLHDLQHSAPIPPRNQVTFGLALGSTRRSTLYWYANLIR